MKKVLIIGAIGSLVLVVTEELKKQPVYINLAGNLELMAKND